MGGSVSAGVDNNDLVDNLLAEDCIKTPSVERVFRAVDRGWYFTTSGRESAYKDLAWKSGNIHLSAPCIYCEVMENLNLAPGMSFLNLGSGTGYLSTMAGLILGSLGINHGVEVHHNVIEYAYEKLEEFKKTAAALEEFDFCEPKFVHGNCLQLDASAMKYDRVYCGAACPPPYENYMKNLIKVGGVLVIPLNDRLLKITRVSQNVWEKRPVLPVAFAYLVEPAAGVTVAASTAVVLPIAEPISLMEACRTKIRGILHNVVDKEHPEFKVRLPPKHKSKKQRTLQHLFIPMFGETDGMTIITGLNRVNAMNSYPTIRRHRFESVWDSDDSPPRMSSRVVRHPPLSELSEENSDDNRPTSTRYLSNNSEETSSVNSASMLSPVDENSDDNRPSSTRYVVRNSEEAGSDTASSEDAGRSSSAASCEDDIPRTNHPTPSDNNDKASLNYSSSGSCTVYEVQRALMGAAAQCDSNASSLQGPLVSVSEMEGDNEPQETPSGSQSAARCMPRVIPPSSARLSSKPSDSAEHDAMSSDSSVPYDDCSTSSMDVDHPNHKPEVSSSKSKTKREGATSKRGRSKRKEAEMEEIDYTCQSSSLGQSSFDVNCGSSSDENNAHSNGGKSKPDLNKRSGAKREKVDSGFGEDINNWDFFQSDVGSELDLESDSDSNSDSDDCDFEDSNYKEFLRRCRPNCVDGKSGKSSDELRRKKTNAFIVCMRSKINELPLPQSIKSYINFHRNL